MRHRNNVRILGRSHEHRKAMYANMVTSLFQHERIITTKQKGKELKRLAERLITRAKENLNLTENDNAKKLHNKREVMRLIHNEDVVKKLFDDIAPRFVTRPGGYTRMYLLDRRQGDAAEMAIVELVVKTEKKQEEKKDKEKKNKEKKSNKTT
ncbi:MAG TPA: 50S ribosomal protein L17 [Spirochaetota bacterium]|nr:50S ribosomal protein L17 [Spirochaetota bacterium]HOR93634.1 50S ribosomal protein L17 [Spirochaetota bacterium]HPD04842.1 50S ribosomal protein L17 [Spirochaetota bacterium]HPK44581.1 50S ribosomal protein L17 [Spirochaetota bacterium]